MCFKFRFLKRPQFGRKRSIDREKIVGLYRAGTGATEIARQERVGRSTVYKLLKELEGQKTDEVDPGCRTS
jgi:hypothetical protein